MPNIEEKQKVVASIQDKLAGSKLVIFTDYRGLNVDEMTELRTKLRIPGVEFKVCKNTMLSFALRNLGYESFEESLFGPNAVLFSSEDLVTPAKVITEFARTHKKLEVKMALIEGKMFQPDAVKNLAELPPREVLIAQVLGTMQAPITSFVRVLNANITGLARAIDQIREKKQAS